MQEPLILRGLLQFVVICAFFMIRYILDVLLTPAVLDSFARDVCQSIPSAIGSAWPLVKTCYAPLMPVLLFQAWKWCNSDIVQRVLLLLGSIRLLTGIIMNDAVSHATEPLAASRRSPCPQKTTPLANNGWHLCARPPRQAYFYHEYSRV